MLSGRVGNSRQNVALAACRVFLAWEFGRSHPAADGADQAHSPQVADQFVASRHLEVAGEFRHVHGEGARDLALAALALDTGLRCAELCHVALPDVNMNYQIEFAGANIQCGMLQVVIKGGDWASAVFSLQTVQYIQNWLAFDVRRKSETVFVSITTGDALTPEGLWKVVHGWGVQTGIKKLSPHVFRRTFSELATLAGGPSRVVQLGGRWNDIRMVERYTRNLQLLAMVPYLPVPNLLR
jgi:integrase